MGCLQEFSEKVNNNEDLEMFSKTYFFRRQKFSKCDRAKQAQKSFMLFIFNNEEKNFPLIFLLNQNHEHL